MRRGEIRRDISRRLREIAERGRWRQMAAAAGDQRGDFHYLHTRARRTSTREKARQERWETGMDYGEIQKIRILHSHACMQATFFTVFHCFSQRCRC